MRPTPKPRLAGLSLICTLLCLVVTTTQADPGNVDSSQTKERLVLMPLRLSEADLSRQAAMEIALLEGLQQKYEVFSGERVAKKAHEIFNKESRNTAHKECDETRCMQDIAEAFQVELIAIANVSKQEDGYFLALSIQNVFDNKNVYSKSLPCKNCDAYQVVEKLKELSSVPIAVFASTGTPETPIIPKKQPATVVPADKTGKVFKECPTCPTMIVIPAGDL